MNSSTMPQSIEAERAVLSSCIALPSVIDQAVEMVKPEYFTLRFHRTLFDAITLLHSEGRPVDCITIADCFTPSEIDQLSRVMESATYLNIRPYVDILREKWRCRELITISRQCQAGAFESCSDDVLTRLENGIMGLTVSKQADTFNSLDTLKATINQIERAMSGGDIALKTGFPTIDDTLGGLYPDDLIVIAARPSTGKTAFMLNVAVNLGAPVLVFSLEQPKEALQKRIISMMARIEVTKLRDGKLTAAERKRFNDCLERVAGLPIFYNDNPSLNVHEIRSIAKRMFREHGIRAVIIDYTQKISDSGKYENKILSEGEKSFVLKQLARELNIPVIALSQMSRDCEKRSNHRPVMSDLRWSGELEQDSDVISFLYKPSQHGESEDKSLIEFIVAKNREGDTGSIDLHFESKFMTFKEKDNTF